MKENPFKNKNILVGITGSIAAYKMCEVIRELKRSGATIITILTQDAKWFVTETTLRGISGGEVFSEMFKQNNNDTMPHIRLSDWADIFLVAPATANIVGKFTAGIADDLLTTTFLTLSHRIPVVIAPAMNENMYINPIVQKNIQQLESLKINFVGPEEGELACGYTGKGRLADSSKIIKAMEKVIAHSC